MQGRNVTFAMRFSLPGLICAAGLALVPGAAQAQSLGDKYWIELTGYWADVDSKAQVTNKNDPAIGTVIDFESDLDLSNSKGLPSVSAGARFGHFVIGADYYSLNREATRTIGRNITFDGVTYPVGVEVTSGFDSNIYRLTVGYNFIQTESAELGLALGLHATDFTLKLSGRAQVGTNPTLTTEARRRSALAPLPTIGAYGGIEIAKNLTLSGRVDWLSLKIDDYKGQLWNAQAQLNYRIFKNVGLGVMYRYVDYDLDADKPNWYGTVSYRFSGPAVVLHVGFK